MEGTKTLGSLFVFFNALLHKRGMKLLEIEEILEWCLQKYSWKEEWCSESSFAMNGEFETLTLLIK